MTSLPSAINPIDVALPFRLFQTGCGLSKCRSSQENLIYRPRRAPVSSSSARRQANLISCLARPSFWPCMELSSLCHVTSSMTDKNWHLMKSRGFFKPKGNERAADVLLPRRH